jgi:hypothetical protein
MMMEDRGDNLVDVHSDIVASSVENNSLMQHSITDRQGMGMESREYAVGVDRNSGVGVGLDGIVMWWRGIAQQKM